MTLEAPDHVEREQVVDGSAPQVISAALVQYTAPAVSFHASVLLVAELFAEEDRKALERVEAEHFSDWCHGRCNGGVS